MNFALDRWRVDGISNPVKAVVLNSLSKTNEIYELIHSTRQNLI